MLDGDYTDTVANPSVLLSDFEATGQVPGYPGGSITYDGIQDADGVCQPTNPVITFAEPEILACMTNN